MKMQAGSATAPNATEVPLYLSETYWWAYVHREPSTCSSGNGWSTRSCGDSSAGCATWRSMRWAWTSRARRCRLPASRADLTAELLKRAAPGSTLDVVDVLPLQLANLTRKLPRTWRGQHDPLRQFRDGIRVGQLRPGPAVLPVARNAGRRPEGHRIADTLRVAVKPGGRVVIVDYRRRRL